MAKNLTQIEKIARAAAKATYEAVLKTAQSSRHDQVLGLLDLNTGDASVVDNGDKVIVTFSEFGRNKIEQVKKVLNVPATQKTLAALCPGGLYFYESAASQHPMNMQ